MSGGILALFGVCLGTALLELLIPGEDKKGPRRILHILTALVVLLMILRPAVSLLGDAEDLFRGQDALFGESEEVEADYAQVFSSAVACRSADALTEKLYDWIEDEFDLTERECLVTVTLDGGGDLSRIEVRLQKSGLLQDPAEIEKKLGELFACEVEVR